MTVAELACEKDYNLALQNAGEKLVVVDFYAIWCGPCKLIAPKVSALSDEHIDVVFYKLNVDEVPTVAASQDVRAMPTFALYKNQKKIAVVVGANYVSLKNTIETKKKEVVNGEDPVLPS